jgi:hypothetical protein
VWNTARLAHQRAGWRSDQLTADQGRHLALQYVRVFVLVAMRVHWRAEHARLKHMLNHCQRATGICGEKLEDDEAIHNGSAFIAGNDFRQHD